MSEQYKELNDKPDDYYLQARPEMMEFIPENSKKILDAGCGEGYFGKQLKERNNAEVWGIEIEDKAAQIAEKNIDKVLCGSIEQHIAGLPDNYFDCIVFNDVLEHLADPYSVLKNIKQKLAINGLIVSSIPNVRYFFTLYGLLIKKQWKYEDFGVLDRTHLRFFTKKSIIDMFGALGYDVISIKGINPIRSWKFKILNALSLGYLSDTCYLQYATVVKPK